MTEADITEPFLIRLRDRIDRDPDITAAGLSVKAGLSNAAIRHWFNRDNKGPTISSARKVCHALGTTLEEFMSNAQTSEEREIVALTIQLPVHLRQKLLGYGQALLEQEDPSKPQAGEE